MPQKGPQTCAIRPKKLVETSSIVPYCKAVHIWDGTLKFGRALKISPERVLPTKTARNSHFWKNICAGLYLPEVPARVMSYWSESPCSSRLHECLRDREEFPGPENWLVTGAARHEMPQKGPQMCATWPKNRSKSRQMSPTVRLVVFGMAPRNLVGLGKSAWSVCAHKNGAKRPFSKGMCAGLSRLEVPARVVSY